MNKIVKIIILIVYTLCVLGVGIYFISNKKVTKNFDEYTVIPYNDDITINVQALETRSTSKINNGGYDYSRYDLKFVVRKVADSDIKNLRAYVTAESNHGHKYVETTSGKTMATGNVTNTTMSLGTKEYAYQKVTTNENGEKSFEDYKPKKFYIKISYEIKVTKDGEKVFEQRTLNYKFNIESLEKNYSTYTEKAVNKNSSYIDNPIDFLKMKLRHSVKTDTDKKIDKDVFIFDELELVSKNLPENTKIKDLKISIDGNVVNKEVNTKYFSEYIRLFDYNGALDAGKSISTNREVTIESAYQIEQLFVTINATLSDGTVKTSCFYINVKDLSE